MKRRATFALALAGLLLAAQPAPSFAAPPEQSGQANPSAGFVVRKGDQLLLDGKKFRFAGTNNYYLMN
ncbi:hypothetical protein ACFP2T_15390 [Plantactinospora solaniradicis]|uniref:Uncharacterized protein n=1 Tax=Plantactinospora solaniradicis TaxID=1723736 RepID=A0ABW1K6X2_9ACTN